MVVRITKEFKFEMAHALYGYDGLCANIHGHSYKLWVTVKGEVKNENGHTKDGMLMDFTDLKSIVKPEIVDKYDHSLVLNANSPHADLDLSALHDPLKTKQQLVVIPNQRTLKYLETYLTKPQLQNHQQKYRVIQYRNQLEHLFDSQY
jgi:6-pyruvoyltetrahydropterin/6-carboxytetrahydropterin synthase